MIWRELVNDKTCTTRDEFTPFVFIINGYIIIVNGYNINIKHLILNLSYNKHIMIILDISFW